VQRLTHTFTSDVRELAPAREFVRRVCGQAWGSDPETDDAISLLILAVDEAATNIILHAYERRAGEPIELALETDGEQAVVTFLHNGRDFDPATVPPPSYDGTRESGFGVRLIQQAVDDVRYGRSESGQCVVRLVKRRRSHHP
jgi:anti-sigma regulatory factor (Ser/Thr protein kinase)